ncbi:MAG: twin-arginine translocase subunit TatC [Rickettsiales bacterium]|jgi:sec-independent protein translocase protein TatC|nr:twin-arginine translocase subunit TatC [Rickettsiales bacterium]
MSDKMTLLQHFSELRRRLGWVLLVFCVGFGVGWFVAPSLQEFLSSPLLGEFYGGQMLYTGVADGLMIQFDLSILFALFVSAPFVLWHLWAFVSPGLRAHEKYLIAPILVLSPLLFLIGMGFAFYVLFPIVFGFFVELNRSAPVPTIFLPATKNYLSFVIGMLKIFGLSFQLPLVMVLLNRLGVLSRRAVIKSSRYVIVGLFIVAAILTPPDIVSQCILAMSLLSLFGIAILFMKK